MSWWKLVARALIVAGALIWIQAAMGMETRGQTGTQQRSGRLAVALLGCLLAWGAWRRLDGAGSGDVRGDERDARRGRDAAGRPMLGGPLGDAPPLPSARLDLGACPACGSSKSPAVTRGPDGRVRARCRDCGLVGTPPGVRG